MGTMVEEILEAPAGESVVVEPDLVFSHDATTPLAMTAFERMGGTQVAQPEDTAVVFDHMYPAPNEEYAGHHREIEAFVEEQGIAHLHRGEGICHQVLFEEGHATPGAVVVGADSHTPTMGAAGAYATGLGSTDVAVAWKTGQMWLRVPETTRVDLQGSLPPAASVKDLDLHLVRTIGPGGASYQALEYGGPALADLSVAQRMTLTNMSTEMEAATGVCEVDDRATDWLAPRTDASLPRITPTDDAEYTRRLEVDLDALEPLVARPHEVDDVVPAREAAGAPVDQVFLGTCTNGRYRDVAAFAEALASREVAVPTVVVPASRAVLTRLADEGHLASLHEAGVSVGSPGCGPCLGRQEGVLAEDEVCFSTQNRNYQGRMGHPESEVWLGSPRTAAAVALAGEVRDPRDVLPRREVTA